MYRMFSMSWKDAHATKRAKGDAGASPVRVDDAGRKHEALKTHNTL